MIRFILDQLDTFFNRWVVMSLFLMVVHTLISLFISGSSSDNSSFTVYFSCCVSSSTFEANNTCLHNPNQRFKFFASNAVSKQMIVSQICWNKRESPASNKLNNKSSNPLLLIYIFFDTCSLFSAIVFPISQIFIHFFVSELWQTCDTSFPQY